MGYAFQFLITAGKFQLLTDLNWNKMDHACHCLILKSESCISLTAHSRWWICSFICWCFEPNQPLKVTSGLSLVIILTYHSSLWVIREGKLNRVFQLLDKMQERNAPYMSLYPYPPPCGSSTAENCGVGPIPLNLRIPGCGSYAESYLRDNRSCKSL